MWNLEDALALVRRLQPMTRNYNYHLALGGGVLNKGTSDKDLDLYFLTLDNDKKTDREGLLVTLERIFGKLEHIGSPEYLAKDSAYKAKVKFVNSGKRIDAFVV